MRLCGSGDSFPAGGAPWEAFRVVNRREALQRPGRDEVGLGPSQISVSEFSPCASAASKVRARPLSGRADLTFRGPRGGGGGGGVLRNIGNRSISRAWWRMSQYSGVRGRRMPANSSSNLLSCNVGQSPSTPFFFLFLVNVPKAFPLPNTCGLIFREARKS